MPSSIEVHNGTVSPGDQINFAIEDSASVIVSNVTGDATAFDLDLMLLRKNDDGQLTDYQVAKPEISFDNDNNYQILTAGFFALKVVTGVNLIITVTKP